MSSNRNESRFDKESRLFKYKGPDQIVSSHEISKKLKAEVKTAHVFKTGVETLDRLLDNVEPGELIVVTGPTGNGKTTLLTSITKTMSESTPTLPLEATDLPPGSPQVKSNTPCAWFTLEVTPRQFIAKFGDNLPLFYMPDQNTENNIDWLIDRIIEANVKYNVQMVFIDHLHQIFSIDRFQGKNLSLELGDVVAKLKQIAVEYNMVIWLIAHGTDDKERINREPRMTDVRDSGMIIRLADVVMGVWRIPNAYSGRETTVGELGEGDTKTKVRVWKNRRNGTLGYFVMNFENKGLVEIPIDDFGVFGPAQPTRHIKR